MIMLGLTLVFAALWRNFEKSILMSYQTDSQLKIKWKYGILLVSLFGTFLPMYIINAGMSYVGNDYANYVNYYRNIASGVGQDVEYGYKLINQLVIKAGLDFQWVYFITCFIAYILLIVCIRTYSSNYAVSYLLFFTGGFFFLLGLNQIRQFVAVGCVLLAFQFIEKKKPLIYFGLVICGGLFHITAFVMLPFYFILGKRIHLSFYAVISLIILPINFFFNDIMVWLFKTFMPRYLRSDYVSRTYELEVPYLVMIIVTVVVVLFLIGKETGELSGIDRVFLNGCMISVVLATVCSWLPEYARFVYYFFIPTIFYIPKLLNKMQKRLIRILVLGIVVIADLVYVFTIIGYSNVLPYKSIF